MCNPAFIAAAQMAAQGAVGAIQLAQQKKAADRARRAADADFRVQQAAITRRTAQEQDNIAQQRFEGAIAAREAAGEARVQAGARGAGVRTVNYLVRTTSAAFGRNDARRSRQFEVIEERARGQVETARRQLISRQEQNRFNLGLGIASLLIGTGQQGAQTYFSAQAANNNSSNSGGNTVNNFNFQ